MWTSAFIVTFILTLTCQEFSAATLTVGTSCSKQRMLDCEMKALNFFNSANKSENEYDTFCEDLKNDSDCPLHVPEDCKKHYPSTSAQYTSVFEQINVWCFGTSAPRKVWFTLGFCYFEHQKEIGKCYQLIRRERMTGNPNQTACEYYEFFNCMHDQVLNHCGNGGEVLVNFLQGITQSFPEYCRGGVHKSSNYWILDLLCFFSLVLFKKIWN